MSEKRKIRIARLETPLDVRCELGRVYRALRNDQMSPDKARACATVLNLMTTIMRDTDLEKRIVELESHLGSKGSEPAIEYVGVGPDTEAHPH